MNVTKSASTSRCTDFEKAALTVARPIPTARLTLRALLDIKNSAIGRKKTTRMTATPKKITFQTIGATK